MKVLLLSPANNIHTIRWANGLAGKGLEIHVCSIHDIDNSNEAFAPQITVTVLKSKAPKGYLLAVKELRHIISSYKPDIMNAHYATGYGTLARLTGFYPYLLSVWGSDVYDFPKKSKIHRWFLRQNLRSATAIASTSHCMAKEIEKTIELKHLFITPFGIDHNRFTPQKTIQKDDAKIVIGTVKTLEEKYGIDILIQAFASIKKSVDCLDVKLEIIGRGSQLANLKNLVSDLNIKEHVEFKGFIANSDLPDYLNSFDIYAAFSRFESFGVAILEASACGLPVVVSDADGLKEVVVDNATGFVVEKNNVEVAAEKITLLIQNLGLRGSMGNAGRDHVLEYYTWEYSLDTMIQTYRDTINLYGKS